MQSFFCSQDSVLTRVAWLVLAVLIVRDSALGDLIDLEHESSLVSESSIGSSEPVAPPELEASLGSTGNVDGDVSEQSLLMDSSHLQFGNNIPTASWLDDGLSLPADALAASTTVPQVQSHGGGVHAGAVSVARTTVRIGLAMVAVLFLRRRRRRTCI